MSDDNVWYGDGLDFSCTQCGDCCTGDPGYVWVTKEEIRRIAEQLGRPDGKLTAEEVRRVGFRRSLTEHPNGDCFFLEQVGDKRICKVYPVRPVQCRTWPFWDLNLFNRKAWDEAAKGCPGMNHGTCHTVEDIRRELGRKAPLAPGDPDP